MWPSFQAQRDWFSQIPLLGFDQLPQEEGLDGQNIPKRMGLQGRTWSSPGRRLQLSLVQFCLLCACFPLCPSQDELWWQRLCQSPRQWWSSSCNRPQLASPSSLTPYYLGPPFLGKANRRRFSANQFREFSSGRSREEHFLHHSPILSHPAMGFYTCYENLAPNLIRPSTKGEGKKPWNV